jgi:uncharacterized membrane protein
MYLQCARVLRRLVPSLDLDLILVLIVGVLLVVFVFFPPFTDSALRSALGLLFAVLAPGYAIIAALFPRKTDFGIGMRIALSLVFSLVADSLMPLILTVTPWGVTVTSITASLISFTFICVLVAGGRRSRIPGNARFTMKMRL